MQMEPVAFKIEDETGLTYFFKIFFGYKILCFGRTEC